MLTVSKPLFSLVLIFILFTAANGTTIVAFRNSNQAVLAADSRYSALATHKELFSANKIKRCGNYYMAIAGLYTIRVDGFVEDLSKIPLVCKVNQDPIESINAITAELEVTYTRMLYALKQANLLVPLSKSSFQPREFELNLILVGSYKGVPFIISRNVEPAFEKDQPVVRFERPWTLMSKLSAGVTEYAFGGVYSDLNSYARQNNLDQPADKLVETARELVDYQINRTPEVSNYPINIVSVSASGKVTWLSCTKTCQAPKPDNPPQQNGKKLPNIRTSGKSSL